MGSVLYLGNTILYYFRSRFGPETVNIFREMIGLPEATWTKQEDDKLHLYSSSNNIQQHHNSKRSTISDFMT